MTRLPREVDPPESLLEDLAKLRNAALDATDFETAVLLSHCHAWLHWLKENWKEIQSNA